MRLFRSKPKPEPAAEAASSSEAPAPPSDEASETGAEQIPETVVEHADAPAEPSGAVAPESTES